MFETTTRRVIAGLIGFSLAVAMAPAVEAASQTIALTPSGYVPRAVSIATGEQVTFTSQDSVSRQLEIKPTSGVTCTANPLVVMPGQSQSCTFASTGNFTVDDPNEKSNTFRATITVTAPTTAPPPAPGSSTLVLKSTSALIVYGTKITLSGALTPARPTIPVDVWARPYPEPNFAKVVTVPTNADGTFTWTTAPQIRTEYKVSSADPNRAESAVLTVQVRPRVTLSLVSLSGTKAKMRAAATSTRSYANTPLLLQRRNSQGGWTTMRTVTLGEFSSVTFTQRVPSSTSKWRVYLQASKAGGGYLAGYSRTRSVSP